MNNYQHQTPPSMQRHQHPLPAATAALLSSHHTHQLSTPQHHHHNLTHASNSNLHHHQQQQQQKQHPQHQQNHHNLPANAPTLPPPPAPPQPLISNSLAIRQEIQRFESVHPSIYAIYDLIDLLPITDAQISQQIRDHVVCIEADRTLSNLVSDAIEEIREQMPCGFPGMAIPPLAPLKIAHMPVNINTPALQLQGVVNNFRLNGLNDFEVTEMKINAILSTVKFRFVFKNINVDTLYDLRLQLNQGSFAIDMAGAGSAQFAINDIHVWGTLEYSIDTLSDKLKLKTLETHTRIGDVESNIEGLLFEDGVNEKLNDFLAEVMELAVNENEDLLTETIESMALPAINNLLDDITLSDMVSGNGSETDACIPSADN